MELKKYLILIIVLNFTNFLYADIIKPAENLTAYDVVKIQLTALKNNNKPSKNTGIKQTWIFAHPENKKYTGPFSNFKAMISDSSYKILLNSLKFQTKLVTKDNKSAKYLVVVDAYDNKRYQLQWILEKAKLNKDCKNCWMTTTVTQPQFIGQLN